MKSKFTKILSVAIVMLLIGVTVGCSDSNQTGTNGEPVGANGESEGQNETEASIKIGISSPVTGGGSAYGWMQSRGARIAVSEINDAGGIEGIGKIVLHEADDEAESDTAISAVQQLIHRDNVVAVVGPMHSSPILASMNVCQEAGIPQIIASGSSPQITKQGNPYVFRLHVTSENAAKSLADIGVNKLDIKKWGILHDADDYGVDAAEAFQEGIEELGIEIAEKHTFMRDDIDYTGQLLNLSKAGVEGIAGFGMVLDISRAMKQASELGLDFQWVGTDALASSEFIDVAGEHGEGTVIPVLFLTSNPDSRIQSFIEEFKKLYDDTPDYYAAAGYDSIYLIKEAIEMAGSADPEKIREALTEIDFFGLTGGVSFDDTGESIREFSVGVWKDGNLEPYE